MGEDSSETESETNENDQRMPDDFFPGESKMDSDIDSEIQRHTSIQVKLLSLAKVLKYFSLIRTRNHRSPWTMSISPGRTSCPSAESVCWAKPSIITWRPKVENFETVATIQHDPTFLIRLRVKHSKVLSALYRKVHDFLEETVDFFY